MKYKNWIKICLDIVMTVLLILMYNKRVISMNFHEIGGLIACGLFFVHKGLNFKWITSVSKRLFSKELAMKVRIGYLINFLLLICVTFIGVSGIMISKTVFTNISSHSMIWKMGHQTVSAFALILVGIHVGLHWTFIKVMFKKIIKLPASISKPLSLCLMALLLVFGIYSMATSSFTKWIISPLTIATINQSAPTGEKPDFDKSNKGDPSQSKSDFAGHKDNKELSSEGRPNFNGDSKDMSQRPDHSEGNRGGQLPNDDFSISSILNVIATYLSILSVFAIATYHIEQFFKKKKQRVKRQPLA